MSILQMGARRIPGVSEVIETLEMDPTWGRWDVNRTWIMATQLDPEATDVGNSGNSMILRPGLMLEYNPTTKLARELTDPTLVSRGLYGILLYAEHGAGAGNDAKWFGYALVGGQIRADGIIVPGAASVYGNLVGHPNETTLRDELENRYVLDDFRDNLTYT